MGPGWTFGCFVDQNEYSFRGGSLFSSMGYFWTSIAVVSGLLPLQMSAPSCRSICITLPIS